MAELINAMNHRRSVRTFQPVKIEPAVIDELKEYAQNIESPFGIDIEYVFLDAEEYHLSAPVLSGEPMYITAKVMKVPYGEEAVGYGFEKLMLKAVSLGLGTVWIGGTMKRELFEEASDLKSGERMPCITPVGYEAKKSLRETMMRKGVGADKRMKAEELFFDNDFSTPLKTSEPLLNNALEAVRWAPSAVNKQPWRIVRRDGVFHFYKYSEKEYFSDAVGDMQRIDMGIALCHFVTVFAENNVKTEIVIADPGIAAPEKMTYIASVKIREGKADE